MRALGALLLVLGASASAGAATRGADEVRPRRYAITLAPDLARHVFSGRETLEGTVTAPTRTLRLDAAGLQIIGARVRSGDADLEATVHYDDEDDAIVLTLPQVIPAGSFRLDLAWSGRLADDLGGFYETDADHRHYAFTHFEPAGAHRAFPCVDTPSAKARFAMTVVVDRDDDALGNAPVESVRLVGDAKIVRFAETEPLPTYLIAVAVGRFAEQKRTIGRTPVRVLTIPGREALARGALDTIAALLPRLEAWFGRPYPFAKLDVVAVPAFAPEAMENAGAIFMRADRMLLESTTASPEARRAMSALVAHEFVHQWLGDLVTPRWWNDLWLSEATTTWVTHTVLDQWRPDWRVWDAFQADAENALESDEQASAHPVRITAATAEDARIGFGPIVYNKGAALLRMLSGWLGEETMREGVGAFVGAHAFANATAEDFWDALEGASARKLGPIAKAWLEEPGHPLLLVDGRCDGEALVVTLRQQAATAALPTTWTVPVVLRWPGGRRLELLGAEPSELRLMGDKGCPAWVEANADAFGFYRVQYSPALARPIADAAMKSLDTAERMGLLADTWFAVRTRGGPIAAFLELVAKMGDERSPDAVQQLARRLEFIDDQVVSGAGRAAFEHFVSQTFGPTYRALGWTAGAQEDEGTRRLRATVIDLLGRVGHAPGVLQQAHERLRDYLGGGPNLDAAMAGTVVGLAALRGNGQLYQSYLRRLRAARTPEEERRYLDALPRFERPELVRRTLSLLLTTLVPAQGLMRFLPELVLEGPQPRALAWEFAKSHFALLERKTPRLGWLVSTVQEFCGERDAEDIGRFLRQRGPWNARYVHETSELIAGCAAWRQRVSPALATWLRLRLPADTAGGP